MTDFYKSNLRSYHLSERDMRVRCPDNIIKSLGRSITRQSQSPTPLRNDDPLHLGNCATRSEGVKYLERWMEMRGEDATCERLALDFLDSELDNSYIVVLLDKVEKAYNNGEFTLV